MSFFSAHIPRERSGYFWDDSAGYSVADGEDRYAENIFLLPKRYEQMRREYNICEGVAVEDMYDPFVVEPALFRIFADLNPTPDAILGFANRYGDIAKLEVMLEDGGLSLSTWRGEIREMRVHVEAADRLTKPLKSRRAQENRMEEIAEFVYPIVKSIQVAMATAVQNNVACLSAHTSCLLDAMKLQLAESVIDRKTYRLCVFCDKPFELSPRFTRSDRKYCSELCRVKACQGRRKEAVKMHKKGSKVAAIAKALGSEVKTIKNWVQGTSRKE